MNFKLFFAIKNLSNVKNEQNGENEKYESAIVEINFYHR